MHEQITPPLQPDKTITRIKGQNIMKLFQKSCKGVSP
jgi:hypothetical protein